MRLVTVVTIHDTLLPPGALGKSPKSLYRIEMTGIRRGKEELTLILFTEVTDDVSFMYIQIVQIDVLRDILVLSKELF